MFTVTQDPLEHLMKTQRAICVKHEHIRLRLMICGGTRLLWRHYRSDSCLNIPSEQGLLSTFIKGTLKALPLTCIVRNRPQGCVFFTRMLQNLSIPTQKMPTQDFMQRGGANIKMILSHLVFTKREPILEPIYYCSSV